jgi:HKD family nuclease
MKSNVFVQCSKDQANKLEDFLRKEIATYGYKRISVCTAYASYSGVLLVRTLFGAKHGISYRWLIGLDDGFSDPKAIKVAFEMCKAETRVAHLEPEKRRFHPKVYYLDSGNEFKATLVIGSCNLTEAALGKNCEVYSIHRVETPEEVADSEQYWQCLWMMGEPVTDTLLSKYSKTHRRHKRSNPFYVEETANRRRSSRIAKAVKESIGNSACAWIALGNNTGGGGQLDIVKNLAPFLGLPENPCDNAKRLLPLSSPLGKKKFQLTFTKGMWRFMNLQQGFKERLRPNLGKASPYMLVITRKSDAGELEISIRRLSDRNAKSLMRQSEELGFLGRSLTHARGRNYGWL